MRAIFIVWCISHSLFSFAQNVGIGTLTPGEKLDVNGNVNVQGNVKVNGVSGTDGQVLMTNNSGATVWGNYCDFKYSVSFQASGFTTWTVPAGVTKIMVEGWGGGGGGAAGGGGGSGAYAQNVANVVPGNVLSITVGTGGSGAANATSVGSNGTNTLISGPVGLLADYGYGAFPDVPGQGGNTGFSILKTIYGNNGQPTVETYAQRSSTEYVTIRKYGDGGKAVMFNGNEGTGATFSFNTVTLSNISLMRSLSGTAAGAGGGGGPNNGILWGSYGSDGLVIIHY